MSLFAPQIDAARRAIPARIRGSVSAVSGLTIEAAELRLPVGSICQIHRAIGGTCTAEVVGFSARRTLLMPLTSTAGVASGDTIENLSTSPGIWCSPRLLGRVLNGFGQPADNGPPLPMGQMRRIDAKSVAPLDREVIRQPISTSIRVVDGLLTCGLGQRMGIFSGPGVGKSTLMSQIAKHTSADVSVVALIGERGREVQEFIENALGPEGLKRCVMIVSTSDDSPLLRVRAARVATTIAEYFRDQGLNVMLLLDSLTRLAQAQRQIGLAAREPPATRGFPPSVFGLIPELLERAGKTPFGSITGFYTVLVDGDDFSEPIADCVKGITDGHLWLSRSLANKGHFPAIDVLQSISRVRSDVAEKDHVKMARRVSAIMATYSEIEDLVNIGAYVAGNNPEYDLAVQTRPKIIDYLKQEPTDPVSVDKARKQLADLNLWIEQNEKAIAVQSAQRRQQAQANPRIARTA
jgi:FliI/YscN family ATPase